MILARIDHYEARNDEKQIDAEMADKDIFVGVNENHEKSSNCSEGLHRRQAPFRGDIGDSHSVLQPILRIRVDAQHKRRPSKEEPGKSNLTDFRSKTTIKSVVATGVAYSCSFASILVHRKPTSCQKKQPRRHAKEKRAIRPPPVAVPLAGVGRDIRAGASAWCLIYCESMSLSLPFRNIFSVTTRID